MYQRTWQDFKNVRVAPWDKGCQEDRPGGWEQHYMRALVLYKQKLPSNQSRPTNELDWTELQEPVLLPFWKVQAQTKEQMSEVLQRLLGLSKASAAL